MEPWQTVGIWFLVGLQVMGIIHKLHLASKGAHHELQKPGLNAADAVINTFILVFFLMLVL